jgi:hypothetical protein
MSINDVSSAEEDAEALMRMRLRLPILEIEWDDDYEGVFANVDSFVEFSKGNNIVQKVYLDPYWYQNRIRRSDANWEEKLGRALGNLQSLDELRIQYVDGRVENHGEEPRDWGTVARVLLHVRQKITLSVKIWPIGGSEEAEAFARAIRGHPTIQKFETGYIFQFHSFDILASALATLPALESTTLEHAELEPEELHPEHLEDLPVIEQPEHMTTLLLSPSLRSVKFEEFYFPNPVCQAVALALKTGSPITCLDFTECNFSDGGGGAIVHALQRNSMLKTLRFGHTLLDDGICDALTSALLVNTTLTELTVHPLKLTFHWRTDPHLRVS